MSCWTVLFSSVIPASGTRQIDKTFIKGLLTIQDQELGKSHNKRFSGDKTTPLASRHIGCFREFPKWARIGNWFLVLLGCPFGRYDLGTTQSPSFPDHVTKKRRALGTRMFRTWKRHLCRAGRTSRDREYRSFSRDVTEFIPAMLVHIWVTWSTFKYMQTQSKIIIPVSFTA